MSKEQSASLTVLLCILGACALKSWSEYIVLQFLAIFYFQWFSKKKMKKLTEKAVFLGFGSQFSKAGRHPNAGGIPEGVSNFHLV